MKWGWPKSPLLWGSVASLGYLGFVLWLVSDLVEDWHAPLRLNELGDFLAGAFAPLAFFWLVVAIFLQKNELSAQREELALAREALGQQITEQRKLVGQSEEQLRLLSDEATARENQTVRERFLSDLKTLAMKIADYNQGIFDAQPFREDTIFPSLNAGPTVVNPVSTQRKWTRAEAAQNPNGLLLDLLGSIPAGITETQMLVAMNRSGVGFSVDELVIEISSWEREFQQLANEFESYVDDIDELKTVGRLCVLLNAYRDAVRPVRGQK